MPSARKRLEFLAAARRSTALHAGLASPPVSARGFTDYLKRFRSPRNAAFWIRTPGGELAGVIHISEIIHGSFCSGYLGYYAFAPHHRQGHMTQGLRMVICLAFQELGLHRLEANIQPDNRASKALVKHLGFRKEGFSPRYLRIGRKWRDHERWALTLEDWEPWR